MNRERKYISRTRITDPENGTVPTCVGKINPKLYGDGLQNLCRKTQDNLSRLSTNMADRLEPCLQYGIKHWHPNDRPKSAYSAKCKYAVTQLRSNFLRNSYGTTHGKLVTVVMLFCMAN